MPDLAVGNYVMHDGRLAVVEELSPAARTLCRISYLERGVGRGEPRPPRWVFWGSVTPATAEQVRSGLENVREDLLRQVADIDLALARVSAREDGVEVISW